jgi:hypothetical protein
VKERALGVRLPYPPPFHVNSFVLGPAVINTHYATAVDIEVDPPCRRFCRRESDFAH